MIITNFRYGGKLVKKVYLGSTLIWKCIDTLGYDESQSSGKALFYLPKLDGATGLTSSLTEAIGQAGVLEFSFISGKTASDSDLKATADLLQTIVSLGQSKDESKNLALSNQIPASLLKSKIEFATPGLYFGSFVKSKNIFSKFKLKSEINAAGNALGVIPMHDNFSILFEISCAGGANFIKRACGKSKSFVYTTSNGTCKILVKLLGESKNTTDNTSNSYCFLAEILKGYGDSELLAKSLCQLSRAIIFGESSLELLTHAEGTVDIPASALVYGQGSSFKQGKGLASTFLTKPLKAKVKVWSLDSSMIGQYYLVSGESFIKSRSLSWVIPALWYPPIGDEIPLVEQDGVDITKNGEYLEIQQAYEISTNLADKTLEVS